MSAPHNQTLAPCGTPMARRRHARHNEQCDACDQAKKRHNLAPCGTRQARRRHQKRGETCDTCTPIITDRPNKPCGTPAAYQRHLRENTPPCPPCRQAHLAYRKTLRDREPKNKPLTPAETAEEVLFLLNAGEGEHAILRALNITQGALDARLRKAGRKDLLPRIFNQWELAA